MRTELEDLVEKYKQRGKKKFMKEIKEEEKKEKKKRVMVIG